MIVVGNKNIPFVDICLITNIDDIQNTKSNSIVVFEYDINILTYCKKNNLLCGVIIKNITQSIFSNSLEALYQIVDNSNFANQIQKIAENYVYDSKILQLIENDEEIEQIALNNIDGVIYKGILWEQ
jgi:hypothetical protein